MACAVRKTRVVGLLLALVFGGAVCVSANDVEPPLGNDRLPLHISGKRGASWREGVYEVWVIDDCRLQQGGLEARAPQAVLWVERNRGADVNSIAHQPHLPHHPPHKAIVYLDAGGQGRRVVVDFGRDGPLHRQSGRRAQTIEDAKWLGRLYSHVGIEVHVERTLTTPQPRPPVYERAMAARRPNASQWPTKSNTVRPVQFQTPVLPPVMPPVLPPAPPPAMPPELDAIPLEQMAPPPDTGYATGGGRSVTVRSRSNVPMQAQVFPSTNGAETVAVITSGVNILIRGLENVGPVEQVGVIDIETDRVVIWTSRLSEADLAQGGFQSDNAPIEFYLEGNIIFRQGDRIIYADRMYYNVNQEFGVMLEAEALTPVDEYQGLVRLKAEVLQQINRENFVAHGAALTTSRLGVPRYWFQAETITFQDRQAPAVVPLTGVPVIDPVTQQPVIDHQLLAASRNNYLYVGGVPVFYWPVMATDLTKPSYFIDRVSVKNDNVFGVQVLTTFDMYHLLGLREPPEGTNWDVSLDVLSERGFGAGTYFEYNRQDFLGITGPVSGFLDAWGIHDNGLDNLGLGRRSIPLEEDFRGRVLGRHRQKFTQGLQLSAELGLISDRNFLEQYYEREWDTFKDQDTAAELKYLVENHSWNLQTQVRLNDFFTQTEWLPRADHFLLGQPLLFERLSWHAHTHAGYARLRTAAAPANPVDAAFFDPLAWEADRQGVRAGTRQELDLPLNLGPATLTPYVLGDATYWGQDLTGDDVTRLYGQTGIRTSIPLWRTFPEVQSELLNLNGLAHKVELTSHVFWADANRDLTDFPLYDPLDDDAQEAFRRRFLFTTFGGVPGADVPLRFDERFYALRTGMQQWVTAPSAEIADDLALARVGVRQRWQTKRGAPGEQRVIDWVKLNVEGTFFPRGDRDNFGADFGLLDYDFQWRLGDRFTLLSDGYFDFFDDGLRTVSLGGMLSRPGRGRVYLGWRSLEGPFSSNILNGSLSYRMSEKWITAAGASIDLNQSGNIGQQLVFTRIGESILFRFGFNYDRSRGNFGLTVALEPRLLPRSRFSQVGGVAIPPPGAEGLE